MILLNDYNGFKIWFRYYLFKYSPPIIYPLLLEYSYKQITGRKPNLKKPVRLSEKINILKVYDVTPEKEMLTDKLRAKEYINKYIPDLKTAKTFHIYDSFDEIDFEKHPKKFIIKTNHACKTGILIKDKDKLSYQEKEKYRKYYKKVLGINYAFWGILEMQYKNIKPKIYTEEYLEDENKQSFNEYEIYCINGNPTFFQYTAHPNGMEYISISYWNPDGKESDFGFCTKRQANEFIPNPIIREKAIKYAKQLSQPYKFVRVDLFEVNNNLYFGEMTFTPFCGNLVFDPDEYDIIFGKQLII